VRYAVVAALGVLFAIGAFIGADRNPGVWIVPPLVLTAVALTVMRLADRRGDERAMQRVAADTGLRYGGQQTLPALTPILVGARPPRVAHVLAGDLVAGGPPVRVGRVAQRSGPPLLVAITDAHDGAARFADPHRILALTGAQHDDEPLEPDVLDWLAGHPLRPALATGEGALVLAAPIEHNREAPFGGLLEAARDAHARLKPRQPLF
jgi:hypothetical protein